jgi:hypothetical protein
MGTTHHPATMPLGNFCRTRSTRSDEAKEDVCNMDCEHSDSDDRGSVNLSAGHLPRQISIFMRMKPIVQMTADGSRTVNTEFIFISAGDDAADKYELRR